MLVYRSRNSSHQTTPILTVFKSSVHAPDGRLFPHHVLRQMWYCASATRGHEMGRLDWILIAKAEASVSWTEVASRL